MLFKEFHIEGRFLTHKDNTAEETYIVLFIKDMKTFNRDEIINCLNKSCSDRIFPHYIIPRSEKDAITKINVSQENLEYKRIIGNLVKQERGFFNKIRNNIHSQRMPMTGIQKNVISLYPKNLFGSIIRYPRNLNREKLNRIAYQLISNQTLLRSILIKNGRSYFWKVYSVQKDIQIPFIDLSEYSIPLKRRFIEDVLPDYFLKYEREKDFLYRLLLVKENIKDYYLVTVADHIICDDFSKEALSHLLKKMYDNDTEQLSIVPYENYSKKVLNGPINISEDEIIESFKLNQYFQSSENLRLAMGKYNEPFNQECSFNIFLKQPYDTSKKWELSIGLLVEICSHYFNISKIPLMILYNGRTYNGEQYFNTIGNFNDYIPILIDKDIVERKQIPEFVYENIRIAVKHCLNFTSLIYDKSLAKKYKKISHLAKQLMPGSKDPSPGIYLDYKLKDNLEDINLSKEPDLYVNWLISGWFVTIKFQSDQYFTISMNVPSKMNRNQLKTYIGDTANKICKEYYPLSQDSSAFIPETALSKNYPLSSIQRSIYIEQQRAPGKNHYHITGSANIYGKLDIYRLKNAFKTLAQYQDVLRTGFRIEDNDIVQFINNEVDIELVSCSSSDLNTFCKPFNLKTPPLFRVGFYKIEDSRFELLIDIHHLIADQISIQMILNSIIQLYLGDKLAPLVIQYKDYAIWQKRQIEADGFKRQREYWIKEFSSGIPRMNLPIDRIRPEVFSFSGETIGFEGNGALTQLMLSFSKQEKVTPFIVFAACLSILLKKYSANSEILFGVPMSTRISKDTQSLIGAFVNIALIKIIVSDTDSCLNIVNKSKHKLIKAYENIEYPMENVCKNLIISPEPNRSAIFDILLVKQISRSEDYRMDDLIMSISDQPQRNTSKTDMSFILNDGLNFQIEYNTDLFKSSCIRSIGNQLVQMIELVLESPEMNVVDLLVHIENNE